MHDGCAIEPSSRDETVIKMWIAFLGLLATGAALPSVKDGSGLVALPLRRVEGTSGVFRRSLPRQKLIDMGQFYTADFQIGNPPQPVTALVDTGSWITWLNPTCSRAASRSQCDGFPRYNASRSTATRLPDLDHIIRYGQDWGAMLEGYSDTFTWGGNTSVTDQRFYVSSYSVGLSTPILGLAPDGFKGFNAGNGTHSFASNMAKQGIIKTRAFSLSIGASTKLGDHSGSLIFGGVDRNRFSGSFFSTPVIPAEGPELKANEIGDINREWRQVKPRGLSQPSGRKLTSRQILGQPHTGSAQPAGEDRRI